jgi:hypothetical protein
MNARVICPTLRRLSQMSRLKVGLSVIAEEFVGAYPGKHSSLGWSERPLLDSRGKESVLNVCGHGRHCRSEVLLYAISDEGFIANKLTRSVSKLGMQN